MLQYGRAEKLNICERKNIVLQTEKGRFGKTYLFFARKEF